MQGRWQQQEQWGQEQQQQGKGMKKRSKKKVDQAGKRSQSANSVATPTMGGAGGVNMRLPPMGMLGSLGGINPLAPLGSGQGQGLWASPLQREGAGPAMSMLLNQVQQH